MKNRGTFGTRRLVLLVFGGILLAAVTVGVAAPAVGDDDAQLTGTTLEQASAAALRHTGGGTVVDSEVGDDGAAYGVEIQLPGGNQVEVNLDGDFDVIGQENDDDSEEGANDEESSSDD